MIENNPDSAAGSCQETGAGGHAGNSDAPPEERGGRACLTGRPAVPDNEADACRCPQCGSETGGSWDTAEFWDRVRKAKGTHFDGPPPRRSTLEILADHWPPSVQVSGPTSSFVAVFDNPLED